MSLLLQLSINSLIASALYALIALGFNLSYSAGKFFNIAHGSMAVVGAYLVFYIMKNTTWPLLLIIPISLILTGAIAYLLDKIFYRPLRRKKVSPLILLLTSLGLFTVIEALVAMIFGTEFQSLRPTNYSPKIYDIGSATVTEIQIYLILTTVIIVAGLSFIINKTTFGQAVRAISDDEEVAKIIGINTNAILSWVFFISAILAGLGGIFAGLDIGIVPTMGLNLLLAGISSAIIGGIGSLYGSLLGALLLGFVENFGIWKISGEWKSTIAFGLLIVFLIVRPKGILGK